MGGFGQYEDLLISKLSALTDPESSEILLTATTDIDDHTQSKRILCDSEGHLQVDIVSMSGGGGGGGGDSSEAKQDLMIEKLDAVNDKLPVDLEVDGSNSLRVVGRFVGNINHREIDTTIVAGGSASVQFGTSGFRTLNVYGAIDVGNLLSGGGLKIGEGSVTISVETSRDNTTWFHYKDIMIDIMKTGNRNSIAETLNVISPQMRITVDNGDSVSHPVKLYIHGIKSRD